MACHQFFGGGLQVCAGVGSMHAGPAGQLGGIKQGVLDVLDLRVLLHVLQLGRLRCLRVFMFAVFAMRCIGRHRLFWSMFWLGAGMGVLVMLWVGYCGGLVHGVYLSWFT